MKMQICITHPPVMFSQVFEALGYQHSSLDLNGEDGAIVLDLSRCLSSRFTWRFN